MPNKINKKGKEYIQSIPLPTRLEKLKKDERGYVIPFFVPVKPDGTPDFKFMDGKKQELCATKRICMICGQKLLDNDYWYISGPLARKNFVSSDPAMHEECARYSLQICPHMHLQKAKRNTDDTIDVDIISRKKPDEIFLINAGNYVLIQKKHYLISEYFNIKTEERYAYENGVLIRDLNFKP